MNLKVRNVPDILRYLKEGGTERNEEQAVVSVCEMYLVFLVYM